MKVIAYNLSQTLDGFPVRTVNNQTKTKPRKCPSMYSPAHFEQYI